MYRLPPSLGMRTEVLCEADLCDLLGASALPLLTLTRMSPVCVCSVMSDSLQLRGLWPARLFHPWNLPGKNTGVGCHFLLQGIFLTQGSNRSLLSPALAGRFCTTAPPGNPHTWHTVRYMQNSEPTANTLMIIQLPWDILLAAKFASGHFFSDEILMPSLCKS